MTNVIGYITRTDNGNFEGMLAMGVSDRLKSSHQCVPKLMKAQEPDFVSSAYVWRKSARAGTARAKLPGNLIFASTFERPNISDRKVYANLGRVKGTKEKKFAMVWNPRT